MSKARFLYVTYIATTAEKVWQALTDSDLTPRWYRLATTATTPLENVSDWKPGSPWSRRRLDEAKTIDVAGKVLESTRPRRLVLNWARPNEVDNSEMNSRVTFNIEPQDHGIVKLTVLHEDLDDQMHRGISGGWPQALSSLKTLLETGHPLSSIRLVKESVAVGNKTASDGEVQLSPAIRIALAHIDAWSRHDWEKTKELLAPDVHAWVTNTQPDFGRTVEFAGVDDYMVRKVRGAQLVEPGSVQVISTFGDESDALVLVTFRIALGPGGSMVTMARACLYSLDGNKKIKEERDEFFVLPQDI